MSTSVLARIPQPVPPADCFHCGAGLPDDGGLCVRVAGAERRVCCPGCLGAVERIVAAGLEAFYRQRRAPGPRPPSPAAVSPPEDYDDPRFQADFVERHADGTQEATLVLEGVVCPSCLWLNERRLQGLPGVLAVTVGYGNRRARVRWDAARLRLSDIIAEIRALGYDAHPYSPGREHASLERERRTLLARLGVAAVFAAQVMMLAVATYAGADADDGFRDLFRWLMLALTVPVVAYSAPAFFAPAWRDLAHGRLGMDVPVSLGILIAFAASVAATVTGTGEVYFDSVVMFTFFLLAGRYLELAARGRAAQTVDNLVRVAPVRATRLLGAGERVREEAVAAQRLAAGDRILVRPGEQVPADARVIAGSSGVDESLLTGESRPRRRAPGARVLAGSVNLDAPLECVVTGVGAGTVLAQIVRLAERAQAERPRLSRLADRAAAWFVGGVLLVAAAVAAWWLRAGDAQWLPITVAVLVVSCPCALSLATPAALTAATNGLLARGLLAVRGDAVEALARTTHVVLDKTGTLTRGRPALARVLPLGARAADACLRDAAALERHAVHPIAAAIRAAARGEPGEGAVRLVQDVVVHAGRGVEGRVDGRRLFLGSAEFIADRAGVVPPPAPVPADETAVWLADDRGALAVLGLHDELRPDAGRLVEELLARGRRVSLMSGDRREVVEAMAARLGIEDFGAELLPDDKVRRVRALQAGGARVAMIGDGVNDAPVLAAADVALVLDSGTDLARAQADVVLLGAQLGGVLVAFTTAERALAIVRQNIAWAIGYNVVALPAAAAGLVPPWLAALGMSASSLAVVANALRILPAGGDAWKSSSS